MTPRACCRGCPFGWTEMIWPCLQWGDSALCASVYTCLPAKVLGFWSCVFVCCVFYGGGVWGLDCCCSLLTPAALFLVTNKRVTAVPLLSTERYPAWSGKAAQFVHASNSSDRSWWARPSLLVMQLTLHYVHFNAEDRRRWLCIWKQVLDGNIVK